MTRQKMVISTNDQKVICDAAQQIVCFVGQAYFEILSKISHKIYNRQNNMNKHLFVRIGYLQQYQFNLWKFGIIGNLDRYSLTNKSSFSKINIKYIPLGLIHVSITEVWTWVIEAISHIVCRFWSHWTFVNFEYLIHIIPMICKQCDGL